MTTKRNNFFAQRHGKIIAPLLVIGVLITIWWIAVIYTKSAIFPTPWQVVTGTLELAKDGTLWEHIGSSLARVCTGFFLAIAIAIPVGLWIGRVDAAYTTLNPIFQIIRPISPLRGYLWQSSGLV